MKKIYLLLTIVLLPVSCTIDYAYYLEDIYVNNSGVEVAIVGKNKYDMYKDVPDSLVILDGASYSISSGFETSGPYEIDVVKVYFNKKTLVWHDKDCYRKGVRDIRYMDHYIFTKTGKRAQQAVYTFTPEDYQLALDLQK